MEERETQSHFSYPTSHVSESANAMLLSDLVSKFASIHHEIFLLDPGLKSHQHGCK